MASAALVNGGGAVDLPPSSAAWLGPRISFSHDDSSSPSHPPENADPEASDLADFEFRLDDPVAMLPADELFSDGKLVPLRPARAAPSKSDPRATSPGPRMRPEISSPSSTSAAAAAATAATATATAISPRAPRCSSRWRDLLGLKRAQKLLRSPDPNPKSTSSASSLKHLLLHRSARSSAAPDAISAVPLLRDSDSESASLSSRVSLSSSSTSSSSGADAEEGPPRLSLDSDKPGGRHQAARAQVSRQQHNPGRVRIPRQRMAGAAGESPRMSASGRVVFTGLERSASSPGSFSHRGGRARAAMERSRSAHVVRVNPVLNVVPVCALRTGSVFGLGQLFGSPSPQKKDREASRNVAKGKKPLHESS